MLPYQMIASGTITSTGAAQDISLQSQNPPDYFFMRNLGPAANLAAANHGWGQLTAERPIEWFWQRAMAQATAKGIKQSSDATNPAMIATFLGSNGISTYDLLNPPTFAALPCTAVTRGSADGVTVVTMTNNGVISIGDRVTLYNVAGMQQISGLDFQVVNTTSTTSITIDLDSSGFAADGTTGFVQKYVPWRYYPRYNWVTGITQATQCVVDVTIDSDFTVGEEVSFRIPTGITTMDQLQNRKGVVTAVTAATTTACSKVTVNIDTTGMTAFALPTSAQAASGVSNTPAMLVPAGSGVVPNQNPPGTNLLDAFDNRNTRVIHLGASLFVNGEAGDIWTWMAFKSDQYNGN